MGREERKAFFCDAGLGSVWGWKTGTAPLFTCGKWDDGAVLSYPGLKISAMEVSHKTRSCYAFPIIPSK